MDAALISRAVGILVEARFHGYEFIVAEGHGGTYLCAEYEEADIYTSELERQRTRRWLISPMMTDSEIVQTAFKLCMTSMEHRCRENFQYKRARIFGPHFDVEDLVALCRSRENAGGRTATIAAKSKPEGA